MFGRMAGKSGRDTLGDCGGPAVRAGVDNGGGDCIVQAISATWADAEP